MDRSLSSLSSRKNDYYKNKEKLKLYGNGNDEEYYSPERDNIPVDRLKGSIMKENADMSMFRPY